MVRFLGLTILSFLSYVCGRRFLEPTPLPRFPAELQYLLLPEDVNDRSKNYDTFGQFPWEMSGLFEGDIVTPFKSTDLRNVLKAPAAKWTMPVPVSINATDFDEKEMLTIEKAITEIEETTCVRFRQFKEGDSSYIVVRGNSKGCWSMVGRKEGGQVINLQTPSCVQHGTVVHEFLHALGLYHQQSSPDRDEYVQIHWENIQKGREQNFQKQTYSQVTTFNLTYDYGSVMHYSEKAFSSNGQPTITPKGVNTKLGQRKGMSELDVMKVRIAYECPPMPVPAKKPDKDDGDFWDFDYLLERFSFPSKGK